MKARAARLLAPVLRDVASCAELQVRVQDGHDELEQRGLVPGEGVVDEDMLDEDMVIVWTPDGAGTGVWTAGGVSEHEQLAEVSDKVHEAVVEGRWQAGLSTSWPPCPWHPDRHPLGVSLRGTRVVWACPSNRQVACQVGQLTC